MTTSDEGLEKAALLLMEPDFGATVVMMGAAAAMLFLGGVGLFRFALMIVFGKQRRRCGV